MLEKMVINGEEKTLYEDWFGSSLLSTFDYRAHCQDFRHQNFLNHYSAVCLLVIPNALLISRAVLAVFRSNLNRNKKIVRILVHYVFNIT